LASLCYVLALRRASVSLIDRQVFLHTLLRIDWQIRNMMAEDAANTFASPQP
jgi:hypothetical protein